MAHHERVQDGGIMLADDWKLYPVDERNWELCHLYASEARGARKASSRPTWHPCGRYYSYNTVPEAALYVIDQKAKERARQELLGLRAFLGEYARIVREVREAVAR